MGNTRIGRRWVEACVIGLASCDGPLHISIDVQDHPLSTVLAELGFIPTPDDGEGLHDIIDVIMSNAVEVEVGGVEFTAQQEAPFFIPTKGRAIVAAVFGKGFQIPGGVSEFEDT